MSLLVLPGDALPLASSSKSTIVGPGIGPSTSRAGTGSSSSASNFVATRTGLRQSSTGKGKSKSESYWIEGNSKRYIPAQRDLVLGTIIARHAEGYRVDIGSAQMASLDALAFEGATKRSKPNLKVGTLVYARVSLANRDMEPEIECFDAATGKSDGFGELKGGFVVQVTLQLCRQMLKTKYPLLPTLAAQIPFETAIGINGRAWFKAQTVTETITLKRIVEGVDDGSIAVEKGVLERKVKEFMA